MEVYFTYVLKSKTHNYFYRGHCKDLQKRLDQHNAGMTVSLRSYLPFEIIYFEQFETEIEAVKREKYFKTSRGREFLKKTLAL
jgi:putative endonuclease